MSYRSERSFYGYQVANYVCTTAFVILLYDSIITIADEVSGINCSTFKTHDSATFVKVQVIWPGALTFPKLLYYINRYLMIAFSLYCTSGLYIYYVGNYPHTRGLSEPWYAVSESVFSC
jgi:hypothetical protein